MKKRAASDRERVTRPQPERTRPHRSFSTLFGAPAPGRRASEGSEPPRATGATSGKSTGGKSASGKSASDPIGRAVGLGYQVMEEYMRQGQRVASAMSMGGGDPQKLYGMGNIADLPVLTERMFRYAQDFASVWLDVMGAMTSRAMGGPGGPPNPGAAAPDQANDDAPAPRPAGSELTVLVTAKRQVSVSVQLNGARTTGPVVASDLRLADGARPRLTGVEVERGPGERLTVRLAVPDDQPPGEYHGSLIDEDTSRLVGRLHVQILGAG